MIEKLIEAFILHEVHWGITLMYWITILSGLGFVVALCFSAYFDIEKKNRGKRRER